MIGNCQSASTPLEYELEHLQAWLSRCGHRKLGNLFSQQPPQITKTIQAVRDLLHEREKDKQKIAYLSGENKLKDNQIITLDAKLDRQIEQTRRAYLERDTINLKLNNLERSMKDHQAKWLSEKEMLLKSQKGFISKQMQYQKELKRQQLTINLYNDKLIKYQDKVVFKNSFEVTNKFIGMPSKDKDFLRDSGNSAINQIESAFKREIQALREDAAWFRQCLKCVAQRLMLAIDKVGFGTTFKVEAILGPKNQAIFNELLELIQCIEDNLPVNNYHEEVNTNACSSCNETAVSIAKHRKLIDQIVQGLRPFIDLSLPHKFYHFDEISIPNKLPTKQRIEQQQSGIASNLNKIKEMADVVSGKRQQFITVVRQMQWLIRQTQMA